MTALLLSILVLYGVVGQIDFTGEITVWSVVIGVVALGVMLRSIKTLGGKEI